MTTIEKQLLGRPVYSQAEIIAMPDGDYTRHFQPTYSNQPELMAAVENIEHLTAPTTPENIIGLRHNLAAIAMGQLEVAIVLEGRCSEPLGDVGKMVGDSIIRQQVVEYDAHGAPRMVLGLPVFHIRRGPLQSVKPRSNAVEVINGVEYTPYMGDAINGQAITERAPNPAQLQQAIIEGTQVVQTLGRQAGEHTPIAHEALSLTLERALVRQIEGKHYQLSADLPWVGMRTNGHNGYFGHIEVLQGIENSVGVKIGVSSSAEHIKELAARFDGHLPGKLVFMLRLGTSQQDQQQLPQILEAIKQHAPQSVLLYDIHGTTLTNQHGQKIRATQNIIQEITALAGQCKQQGLQLHGVHLETTGDSNRLECVDTPNQRPTHPGSVDPQLNPRQLARVLSGIVAAP